MFGRSSHGSSRGSSRDSSRDSSRVSSRVSSRGSSRGSNTSVHVDLPYVTRFHAWQLIRITLLLFNESVDSGYLNGEKHTYTYIELINELIDIPDLKFNKKNYKSAIDYFTALGVDTIKLFSYDNNFFSDPSKIPGDNQREISDLLLRFISKVEKCDVVHEEELPSLASMSPAEAASWLSLVYKEMKDRSSWLLPDMGSYRGRKSHYENALRTILSLYDKAAIMDVHHKQLEEVFGVIIADLDSYIFNFVAYRHSAANSDPEKLLETCLNVVRGASHKRCNGDFEFILIYLRFLLNEIFKKQSAPFLNEHSAGKLLQILAKVQELMNSKSSSMENFCSLALKQQELTNYQEICSRLSESKQQNDDKSALVIEPMHQYGYLRLVSYVIEQTLEREVTKFSPSSSSNSEPSSHMPSVREACLSFKSSGYFSSGSPPAGLVSVLPGDLLKHRFFRAMVSELFEHYRDTFVVNPESIYTKLLDLHFSSSNARSDVNVAIEQHRYFLYALLNHFTLSGQQVEDPSRFTSRLKKYQDLLQYIRSKNKDDVVCQGFGESLAEFEGIMNQIHLINRNPTTGESYLASLESILTRILNAADNVATASDMQFFIDITRLFIAMNQSFLTQNRQLISTTVDAFLADPLAQQGSRAQDLKSLKNSLPVPSPQSPVTPNLHRGLDQPPSIFSGNVPPVPAEPENTQCRCVIL